MAIRSYFSSSRNGEPLSDPIKGLKTWDIVRFRPRDKNVPESPKNIEFMPGIVMAVCHKNDVRPTLIIMPICFLPEMSDYDPKVEQQIKDTRQMRLMGLLRNDPRLVRTYVKMSIPNGDGFLSSESFTPNETVRSVPQTLASVITRKFAAAVELKAQNRAHWASSVYGWAGDSPS